MAPHHEGSKRRPRAAWHIQAGTHEALITTEEAEAILARGEGKRAVYMRGGAYLLSGLLIDPKSGKRWHGDQGYYRCGRRRLSATNLEQQILEHLARELCGDAIVKQAAERARAASAPNAIDAELRVLQRQGDDLERKIGRVRNVMTTMDHPEAMAPKLVELTETKRDVDARMAAVANQVADAKVMRMITEEDVRAFLRNFVENLKSFDRAEVKARLRMLSLRLRSTQPT
jgi:hypothetical protein